MHLVWYIQIVPKAFDETKQVIRHPASKESENNNSNGLGRLDVAVNRFSFGGNRCSVVGTLGVDLEPADAPCVGLSDLIDLEVQHADDKCWQHEVHDVDSVGEQGFYIEYTKPVHDTLLAVRPLGQPDDSEQDRVQPHTRDDTQRSLRRHEKRVL